MSAPNRTATLREMLALLEVCFDLDGAILAEDWYVLLEAGAERDAEQEAEMAWLRAAESAGWEEEYLESLYRSGLRVAY